MQNVLSVVDFSNYLGRKSSHSKTIYKSQTIFSSVSREEYSISSSTRMFCAFLSLRSRLSAKDNFKKFSVFIRLTQDHIFFLLILNYTCITEWENYVSSNSGQPHLSLCQVFFFSKLCQYNRTAHLPLPLFLQNKSLKQVDYIGTGCQR